MPRRLEMSDKGVELMAFLSLHTDATEDQIVGALWPSQSVARGGELLVQTVAEVNRVVARATGNPSPVIAAQGQVPGPAGAGRAPRVVVRVMVSEPFVEVYAAGESLPGEVPGR